MATDTFLSLMITTKQNLPPVRCELAGIFFLELSRSGISWLPQTSRMWHTVSTSQSAGLDKFLNNVVISFCGSTENFSSRPEMIEWIIYNVGGQFYHGSCTRVQVLAVESLILVCVCVNKHCVDQTHDAAGHNLCKFIHIWRFLLSTTFMSDSYKQMIMW